MQHKHIKFEKYDTVKIVCNGDELTYFGLFYSHSQLMNSICSYDGIFPMEVKMIKGSQRGTNLVFTIRNVYGIKIMPARMVLMEKIKNKEHRDRILAFKKSPANGFADY